ncbi:MAG: phytoene/squalene synthase family protein [Terriglobales bacterium]
MTTSHPLQLRTAYGICRHTARSTAKNFYYGFLVLPGRKRDAISAVYAFMRHADDISDDPQIPTELKREKLNAWLQDLEMVIAGRATDDPVLMAVADAQRRYDIPFELLEKLVYGTTMDCFDLGQRPGESGPSVLYRSFDDLYNYCYHVASVVGLVCIKIFGYRDPKAEHLAEHLGVAFQLTNIIRDVKEDASMGRIYLPSDDLTVHGVPPQAIIDGNVAALRPVLELQAQRAREFYADGEKLLPLIDGESEPALWTLMTIYRRLLEKIGECNYDVFSERVRLTTWEKTKILIKGLWRRVAG